jgi:hypothetical protein
VQITHGGNTRGFTAEMFFLPEHGIGIVMLSNLRMVNHFLAAIGQKLLEVLFGAESKAEAMVTSGKRALDEGTELMHRRIKTDAASTAWIRDYTGHYVSELLGPAWISQIGEDFQIEFEAGSSRLGVEDSGTSRHLVLTTPPWAYQLQLTGDPNTLLLDGGQTRYEFVRVQPPDS